MKALFCIVTGETLTNFRGTSRNVRFLCRSVKQYSCLIPCTGVITGLTEEEERDRIYPTTQPLFPQFEQWSYAMENEWVANAMADVTYDSDNRFDQPDGPAEPTLDEVIDESVCKTIDPGQRLSDDGDFRLALESVRKPKVAADPTQLTALLSQLTGTLPASGPGSALRPPTSGILTNHLTSPFNAFTPTSSSNAMPLVSFCSLRCMELGANACFLRGMPAGNRTGGTDEVQDNVK